VTAPVPVAPTSPSPAQLNMAKRLAGINQTVRSAKFVTAGTRTYSDCGRPPCPPHGAIYPQPPAAAEKAIVQANHDTAIDQALLRVAARFPGGQNALETHTAYRTVRSFLQSAPMVRKFHGAQLNKGKLLYNGRDGRQLKVMLHFLSANDALGGPDESLLWGKTIVETMSAKYGSKGVPTEFMGYRGGVSYMNTAKLTKIDQPRRGSEPHGFNMVLALNHRTQIEIHGTLSPDDMKRFLRSIDQAAVQDRIAMLD